ncbi:MAG: cupin domain-containing protein [Deltaproteobacteria bacterium]|nr:cupin domain-containing protein [Deltaproteobacteria bacterium]
MTSPEFYPQPITSLPQADLAFEGVTAYLLQGEETQTVFFRFPAGVEVPPHSHCAQWGVMLQGEMELAIGEETLALKKGDTYFIPEGVIHYAKTRTDSWAMDVFFDPKRYRAKKA